MSNSQQASYQAESADYDMHATTIANNMIIRSQPSDDEDVTSRTEVISFTKEDYILQKMLENQQHSSSTSSSEQITLKKKKEELRLKKQQQQQQVSSVGRGGMPVARAYEGSEDSCPEDLDTISRFPAEEELFGTIHQNQELVNKG